jgi:gluconolactonase
MEIIASGFGLLEGPVWDPARGLLVADAEKGGVHLVGRDGRVSIVVEHRRGIGGMARHADGGLVVSGRNIAYKGPAQAATVVLLGNDPANDIVGFNDLTTDVAGRIYAGALGFLPTGTELSGIGVEPTPAPLFLIDIDGSARRVHPSIKITNGLGFSPDGKRLYHADSGDRTVYVYEVRDNGDVGGRTAFASMSNGLPDGLAVAADGSVWVAIAHGGEVVVVEPDGAVRRHYQFPQPMITSLCFGGEDLRDVYVVSGSEGTSRDDAGTVFRMRCDVPGLAMPAARVSIAAANKQRTAP